MVVHAWVIARPFLGSRYLASTSPVMALDFVSRVPATLNTTPVGVLVLTSRDVPKIGRSLDKRSLEDLPRSYVAHYEHPTRRRCTRLTFQLGGTGWVAAIVKTVGLEEVGGERASRESRVHA